MADTLDALISAYLEAQANINRPDSGDAEEAAYQSVMNELEETELPATSFETAIRALRLASEDMHYAGDSVLAEPLVKAALGYFDGLQSQANPQIAAMIEKERAQ